ncbi:MAG: hypothetical protein ACXITV_04555 [Luteibaculaceae bacterium]
MKILKSLTTAAIILLTFFVLQACKEEPATHILNLRSTSNNPYLVEVNGMANVVQGNSVIEYELKEGTYDWKATQQSGYLFFATVRSGTVVLNRDTYVVFP